MKPIHIFVALLAVCTMSSNSNSQDEFPILQGPYMGQDPPGIVAEPFAPGIISSKGWELEGVFAPGMKEFYFTTDNGKDTPIIVIGFRQQNNVWKKYIEFKRKGEVTFSPDGTRMHMAKGYKDRVGDGWSERKSLGPMFDRKDWGIMRLSASAIGTYVFDDYKSKNSIRISTIKDGKRQEPKKLSSVVNTGKSTAHPFIAADESYLIWDSEREGGYGKSDLYISYRQMNGSWGPAINMGDKINSNKGDTYASVTPDGKYILFNRRVDDESGNTDIYWVDAQIIETLRPKADESPVLPGPYLGQKPPGLIPELFAPDIIQTEFREGAYAITPDLKEFYFRRRGGEYKNNTLVVVQYKNNQWTESVVAPRGGQPFFSSDGNIMHLGQKYRERTTSGWSERKSLGPMFDRKDWGIMRLTASATGTYVFDDWKSGDVIRISKLVNGQRQAPKKLSSVVNTGKLTAHPFIAADDSYLIWDSEREGGYGESDLYISFRQEDGSWGPAINLGEDINSEHDDAYGSVTPDGKYFFFGQWFPGDKANIYWVDAQFIEALRPK